MEKHEAKEITDIIESAVKHKQKYDSTSLKSAFYQIKEYLPGILQWGGILGTVAAASQGEFKKAVYASGAFILGKMIETQRNYQRNKRLEEVELQIKVLRLSVDLINDELKESEVK